MIPMILIVSIVCIVCAFGIGVMSTWNGWGNNRCMRCGAIGQQKRKTK